MENKYEKSLFLLVTMDCERKASETWSGDGPANWTVSRKAIEGLAAIAASENVVDGAGFYPTPDTAKKHRRLFNELRAHGFEIGHQFHADSFDRLQYKQHLGFYGRKKQKDILTRARKAWDDALGFPCTTWRAGYGSTSDDTFPLLHELGYRQDGSGNPGRYVPKTHALWLGLYPFAHHASAKSRLICGDLDLYMLPITGHPKHHFSEYNPMDLRPDVIGARMSYNHYRALCKDAIQQMILMEQPIKHVEILTHNMFDYGDRNVAQTRAMVYLIWLVKQIGMAMGLEVVPANYARIHEAADEIGAF